MPQQLRQLMCNSGDRLAVKLSQRPPRTLRRGEKWLLIGLVLIKVCLEVIKAHKDLRTGCQHEGRPDGFRYSRMKKADQELFCLCSSTWSHRWTPARVKRRYEGLWFHSSVYLWRSSRVLIRLATSQEVTANACWLMAHVFLLAETKPNISKYI